MPWFETTTRLLDVLWRPGIAIVAALLMLAQPIFAFQSPLSDESVREAYFLGQRRDGTLEPLIEKSKRRFPEPKNGPYISSQCSLLRSLLPHNRPIIMLEITAPSRLNWITATLEKKSLKLRSKYY